MPSAYSRSDPRYRRLYACHDLRRKGYRKSHEYTIFDSMKKAVKILVWRRRLWHHGVTHDHFMDIYPDGTMKSSHSVVKGLKG